MTVFKSVQKALKVRTVRVGFTGFSCLLSRSKIMTSEDPLLAFLIDLKKKKKKAS